MTVRPSTALALLIGLLAVGSVLLLRAGCSKDGPQITGPPTVVPDKVIEKTRPKPPTTFGQKIVRHRVPATITLSAGTPDTGRAMWYADAAHEADSLRRLTDSLRKRVAMGDQTINLASIPKPRRVVLPPVAGEYKGNHLSLWMTRSDGSLMRATAKLRPSFQFFAGQNAASDSFPIFSEERAWLRTLRQIGKCAPPAGIVAGVGALVNPQDRPLGAIIGGASVLLGCLLG